MQISEVRIKLVEDATDRLKAFCSVTFDDSFVIRDLKIIEGANGLFVAMPSRKITDRCPTCRTKNHMRANFCNECGRRLDASNFDSRDRHVKLHADIAHPINSTCRQMIQSEIEQAYLDELEKSKQPGYKPPKLDFDDEYSGHGSSRPGQESGDTSSEAEETASSKSQTGSSDEAEPSEPAEEPEKGDSGFSEGIL